MCSRTHRGWCHLKHGRTDDTRDTCPLSSDLFRQKKKKKGPAVYTNRTDNSVIISLRSVSPDRLLRWQGCQGYARSIITTHEPLALLMSADDDAAPMSEACALCSCLYYAVREFLCPVPQQGMPSSPAHIPPTRKAPQMKEGGTSHGSRSLLEGKSSNMRARVSAGQGPLSQTLSFAKSQPPLSPGSCPQSEAIIVQS